METMKYEKLTEVQGRMQAELIESFLEAHGVDVELIQEAVGHTIYPVEINGLGRVQIFIPKEKSVEARDLLNDFNNGIETEE